MKAKQTSDSPTALARHYKGVVAEQSAEIERLTAALATAEAERDAALQRIEWTQREYIKGDYTSMALNLFDGDLDDGQILHAEAMTETAPQPAAAPAVDAAPVVITDEDFAAVMSNLDTMNTRQSLSHANLQKDYADGYIEDGELEKAAENLSAAIGHILDALITMQKGETQS